MQDSQRYRVNFKLLAGLLVGGAATAVASWGLWKFQVNRIAPNLLIRADSALKEGKTEDGFLALSQYVRLRRKDQDGLKKWGSAGAELLTMPDVTQVRRSEAYNAIAESVTQTNDKALRRKLLEIRLANNLSELALQDANELLDQGENDAKLKVLKARALLLLQKEAEFVNWSYRLIGYDRKADKFDAAKAEAADQPEAFYWLASHLQTHRQPELAKRIVEQMIAANPKSREAHMLNYRFCTVLGNKEDAKKSLDKAFELDPNDADVLNAKGLQAITQYQEALAEATKNDSESQKQEAEKLLDSAAKTFGEALEKYPENQHFYQMLANIEMARKKSAAALAIIERGLAKFTLRDARTRTGLPRGAGLENQKFEILFNQFGVDKKPEPIVAEIKMLRSIENDQLNFVADFHEGRFDAINEKWAEAARKLAAVKTRLDDFPDLQVQASTLQSFCHQQLGQTDLAREAADWALKRNPNIPLAQALKDDADRKTGQQSGVDTDRLEDQIRQMLERPESEQDWDGLAKQLAEFIDKQAALRHLDPDWIESRKKLLSSQVAASRGEYAKDPEDKRKFFETARQDVTEAFKLKKDDPAIQLWAVKLLMTEPGSGPKKALVLLDKVVASGKDAPPFRGVRAEIVAAIGGDTAVANLNAVTEGMEDWTPAQQSQVWTAVASQFERLGLYADAVRCTTRAAETAPNSLPLRMALFNLALRQSDDAAMKAAQQKILEIVKNPSDPDYVVTEVKRRLVGFAGKTVDEAAMREARTMLDEAIKVRPTFADLYVLRGQLALSVWKDVDAALKDFDEALTRGQANVNAVALQVRLLAERGRYAEARKRMERVPSPMWNSLLDRIAAEVLDQTGESERAVAEAERLADAKPQDGSVQIWCGELAMRNKDYKVAQRTFQRAVDLNPSLPDSWMRLVALYLQERRSDDVERTVREAHLAIDEEYLPLLTAYYYELYGRWREAEDVFQSAFGDREDGFALQHLAEFYLKWSTSNPDYVGKASVYVNRILRASYDKKLPADDPSVAWARRQAARILSLRGEYRESLKAEKLLAPDGTPATTEDAQQLIDVLERRGDPASRLREIELLKKLQTTTALSVQHEELLGRALFDVAEYDAARAQMEDAIGRHPRSLALRAAYIGMLTELKQLDAADRWLVRMNEVPDSQIASLELKLRLAGARGATQAIRQQLEAMTPNLQVLTPKELEKVRAVAVFAEQLGDFEYALKMMHEYVRRAPEKKAELARMVSLHGDVDEAIALLKQLYPDDRENVTMMAVAMARARYAEEPKKVEEELGRLVQSSLRDDPESARFGVLHAEMLEINGKIPESIAAYQQALAMADMPPMIRATAGNNLAYLLALSKQQPQEALKIIDDSMSVLGPISDILDTRGLVYLSMGEPAKAVQDFQNCVRKDATPSKRFHLVRALLAAGEIEAAKTAWKQALDAGLTKDKVAKLELEEFDAVTAKVKSLGVAPPKTASQ